MFLLITLCHTILDATKLLKQINPTVNFKCVELLKEFVACGTTNTVDVIICKRAMLGFYNDLDCGQSKKAKMVQ
jgi:chemotaxis methyl-accepting protein methylase